MEAKTNKKLIEVSLPLEAINKASGAEKTVRHGHPSNLHLWWARRPLAAARAVIFAQMVDDPSAYPDLFPSEKLQEKERKRLFKIIEDLVLWENTTNEAVLGRARTEIWQSWRRTCAANADHPLAKSIFDRNKLPAFHDPFAGGGALPLEAQRLGLESFASDLNPVAVLINKAMIEIPPKFAGKRPINKNFLNNKELFDRKWKGAEGLAEDIEYYGNWILDEAKKKIGHLYPTVEITEELVKERPDLKNYLGQKLKVISWLWARTVKSPNPAFAKVAVPLISTFVISAKPGKEVFIEPIIDGKGYRFLVKVGKSKKPEVTKKGTKLARGANFRCLMSEEPIESDYIKSEGKAGRMGVRLMAIVAEGDRGRVYLSPISSHEKCAIEVKPEWKPETPLATDPRALWTPPYGLITYGDLFTNRQLVALTTFSDLVQEVMKKIEQDSITAGLPNDKKKFADGGIGAKGYADAIGVYLSFILNKQADLGNSLCRWEPIAQCPRQLFGRQAIPMIWDFAEGNPLGESSGSWVVFLTGVVKAFVKAFEHVSSDSIGHALQDDASLQKISKEKVISTDPPYYDNIGYADLSDFFYVWLRRTLKDVFPDLFSTLAVPKIEELVATPYRHGSKEKAETFFLSGMTNAMHRLSDQAHPSFPITIYYAFKQSESETDEGVASTGWETFLEAVIRAGFAINGTWPLRTENSSRMIGQGTNALASSIVLVCRPRTSDLPTVTRRDFINSLKNEMHVAVAHLQRGNIAPVDLAQAAIGPGMAIYTRNSKVLDASGKEVMVREALKLINETLDEVLAQQEGDFDADSRWALTWFEQYGFSENTYDEAEKLSKAKNTSISGMVEASILLSGKGKVRLLKPEELPKDWDPTTDKRLTNWETVHQLIRVLENGGEGVAAKLVVKLGSKAELARELCYRLYTICERKKRPQEALSYNSLVQSWPEIQRLSKAEDNILSEQTSIFEN